MFCPQCGRKCPDDSRFCENCGSPIVPAVPSRPQPVPPVPTGPDALNDTVSEIAENVQRSQVIPAPVITPAYTAPNPVPPPIAPPVAMKKKSQTGLIVALVVILLLLAAAGGGAFYIFHTRAANEADLSANLMEYMWAYCEEDVLDYYDGALSKPYSDRGYKIEQKESSFRIQPSQEKNVFSVSGRVNVIDRTNNDASYRVDIEGTVTANFMRTQYAWDLEYDFEEPAVQEPAEDVDTPSDDQIGAVGDVPAPVPDTPTDTTPSSGISSGSGYLWPTDTQYITDADLDNFSRKEIMLMRNELYARYGCSFQDEEIRTYFESQSWYVPDPDLLAVNFQRDWFNEYETTNLDTILNYERAMGWRQ